MPDLPALDPSDLPAAERVLLLAFDERRRQHVAAHLDAHRRGIARIRELELPNRALPASTFAVCDPFDPALAPRPGAPLPPERAWDLPDVPAPTDPAHADLAGLARMLRQGRTSSRALTERYLDRIRRFGPELRAVVTVMADAALTEAEHADRELAEGRDRGPLHGLPYLAKDLLDAPGAPTTWGAAPLQERVGAAEATVVARLRAAGAVLLGKASLGELAMGDVWFGGTTRNPWRPEEGSSGSSAGSAAAVAADLCAFAIGSETMGSILSPCARCSVSGLRPTFGRLPRGGAMTLAWSLDKLGPIVRHPLDAALVLQQVAGAEVSDPASVDAPLGPAATREEDLSGLRIGIPSDPDPDSDPALTAFLEACREAGADVVQAPLPDLPTEPVMTLLMVEAAAAFDAWVRGDGIDRLTRQDAEAWPTLLRAARFVSGPDYVQVQRLQRVVRDELRQLLTTVDALVTPGLHPQAMLLGNAAGLPVATLPFGRAAHGAPAGNVAVMADAFREDVAIRIAVAAFQRAWPDGPPRPPAFGR